MGDAFLVLAIVIILGLAELHDRRAEVRRRNQAHRVRRYKDVR